jgi:hypothetical protein
MMIYIDDEVETYPDIELTVASAGAVDWLVYDVPDDVANRWLDAQAAWRATKTEARNWMAQHDSTKNVARKVNAARGEP